MSLSSIKQKEAKGKKNVLPKLRTVLANPYKQHYPVLAEPELLKFRLLLEEAISQSELPAKSFATRSHINLGLESSLRAINARRFSCVFISLSLRPAHLVRLIGTSAAVQLPSVPIFAQPKLEEFTEQLFGVRAMALVLPLDLKSLSQNLSNWVIQHQKLPAKVKAATQAKKRKSRPKVEEPEKQMETEEALIPKATLVENKSWSGDYISCTDGKGLNHIDAQIEAQQLKAKLDNLVTKAKEKAHNSQSAPATSPLVDLMEMESQETPTVDKVADVDEFLPSDLAVYRPLTVHQICPNPNKKPKKKRNKNK